MYCNKLIQLRSFVISKNNPNVSDMRDFILTQLSEIETESSKNFGQLIMRFPTYKSSFRIDTTARLLKPEKYHHLEPCCIVGDGNCLFRAISK